MTTFTITKLSQSEVLQMLCKTAPLFTPPQLIDNQQYSHKLADNAEFLVCEVDGNAVGYIAFYRNHEARQIYIPYLVVMPEYHRQGIATRMMDYLFSNVEGYTTSALEVRKDNIKAFNLYKKQKFSITEDRGEKYLMTREL